jgi:nucleoside-diphosphate-sugar epimerase
VLFSTVAVYGDTGPEGVDEDTPPRPRTDYAASKLRG